LLIAALLTPDQVGSLGGLANELGLAVLAEVHNARELEEVLSSDVGLIGVNNRDLDSFEVDLDTTARLAPLVGGSRTVVSESGIETGDDVRTVCEAGADAILVGESLLRSTDRQQKMAELMSAGRVG
ncbi:MAG: indole-3-glycerol-phosphate synthase, partial [Terriglobia bacterium]